MMPLTFADTGVQSLIKKVCGKPEVVKHMNDLGFVPGAEVQIISSIGGNLIVSIRDARVAISTEMAGKIMV